MKEKELSDLIDKKQKDALEAYNIEKGKAQFDYSSVENMALEQKLPILKNQNLNIDYAKLAPWDRYNAIMYRWAETTKHNEVTGMPVGMDPAEYKRVMDEYNKVTFEEQIAPAFQALGKTPPKEALFLQNASAIAHDYNMDEFYKNGATYSYKSAMNALKFQGSQIMKTLGMVASINMTDHQVSARDWKEQVRKMEEKMGRPVGFWQETEMRAKENRNYRELKRYLDPVADRNEALDQFRPFRSYYQYALSGAVQFAPWILVNLIPGLGAEGDVGLAAAIGKAAGGGLRGAIAKGAIAGARGGAEYGLLTRRVEDKHKAWQDAVAGGLLSIPISAVSHMVGGRLSYYGGRVFNQKGGGPPGSQGGMPVVTPTQPQLPSTPNVLEGEYIWNEDSPVYKQTERMMQQKLKLIGDGREPIDAHQAKEISDAATAEIVATHGAPAKQLIYNAAAEHLTSMEALNPEEIHDLEHALYQHGNQSDRDMLDAVVQIRSVVGNRALNSLLPGEKAGVLAMLESNLENVSQNLMKFLPNLQAALRRRITSLPTQSIDMQLLQHVLPQIMQKLGPTAIPEQIAEAVKAHLADSLVEMNLYAGGQITKDAQGEALLAENQRSNFLAKNPKPVFWLERSRQTGQMETAPSKYTKSPSWRIYMKDTMAKRGKDFNNANISEYVRDMPYDEFAADIHAFFIPKFLKDIDLKFEQRSTASGPDHSNLFSFAWNFKDTMPAPYAERLEKELPKSTYAKPFYDAIKNNEALTPLQRNQEIQNLMRKHAVQAWNHVDNFLNTGHFPAQLQLYRATGTHAAAKEYEENMLMDRTIHERQLVDAMFKKGSDEHTNASNVLRVLQDTRRKAVKEDSPLKSRIMSDIIKRELKTRFKPPKTSATRRITMKMQMPLPLKFTNKQIDDLNKYKKISDEIEAQVNFLHEYLPQIFDFVKAVDPRSPEFLVSAHNTAATIGAITKAEIKLAQLADQYNDVFELPEMMSKGPAGWVHVNNKTGETILWLNQYHMFELGKAIEPNAPEEELKHGPGYNVSGRPEVVMHDIRAIDSAPIDPLVKTQLKTLVLEASRHAGPEGVTVMRTGDAMREIIRTLHEERTHGFQRALGVLAGSQSVNEIDEHLDDHDYAEMILAAPDGILEHLAGYQTYANGGIRTLVVEAAAHLIVDDPSEYNVSEDESLAFLETYFNKLLSKHGPDALDNLTTATKAVEDVRRRLIGLRKPGSTPRASTRIRYPGIPD